MPKLISMLMAVMVLSGWTGSVSAMLITDTIVAKDGREWAQVDLFVNTSWQAMNQQCRAGACAMDSMLNGYALDGWTWASIQDVQDLFNAYTGLSSVAPTHYYEINSTWGPELLSTFRATSGTPGIAQWVIGWSSSSLSTLVGRIGVVFDANPTAGPVPQDQMSTEIAYDRHRVRSSIGGWFWREPQSVATPTTNALFVIALTSLAWARRNKKYAWTGNSNTWSNTKN